MAATGDTKLGKIADFMPKDKYDGVSSQDFNKFLDDFDLGARTLELKPTKKYLMLMQQLTGRPREVARDLVTQWEATNGKVEDAPNVQARNAQGTTLFVDFDHLRIQENLNSSGKPES